MNSLSTSSPKHTVLVIASDWANLQLMSQLIARRVDLNLLTAVNGKEGMQLVDASLPEVVVLDTSLSDICAGVGLKHLLGSPRTADTPVIAISAEAMPAHIEAGLQAGFYRYLAKPYKLTDLLQAIDGSLLYNQGKSQGRQTSALASLTLM